MPTRACRIGPRSSAAMTSPLSLLQQFLRIFVPIIRQLNIEEIVRGISPVKLIQAAIRVDELPVKGAGYDVDSSVAGHLGYKATSSTDFMFGNGHAQLF